MEFKKTLEDNVEFITMFAVFNIGCFFGTINKSWGYFVFNLILTTFLVFLIIKLSQSPSNQKEQGK